jgi:hypothetical protein
MSCTELVLLAVLRSAVVSMLGNCAADPRSSPCLCSFFFNHVYNGYGDHNISFSFKFLHFFRFLSSFAHIPEREGAVGFSTCYGGNCLLLRNICSQCLIVNLTTGFHILVQMFVYSCTTEESITKFVCAIVWKIPLC